MIWIWLTAAPAQTVEQLVLERAAAVWSTQAGPEVLARQSGAEKAARRVGIGPSAAYVLAQVGEPAQQQVEVGLEQPLDFGLARRHLNRVRLDEARTQTRRSRIESQLDAVGAWSEWATTHAVLEHVEEHLVEIEAALDPFEMAGSDGAIAPAALADVRVTTSLVQSELLSLRRAEAEQALVAHRWLGAAPLPISSSLEQPLPTRSPWGECPAARLPSVAAARSATLRAEAGQAAADRLPVVQGGVMWAPDSQDKMVPFATLGVRLPLQSGRSAERRRFLAEANGALARADWERDQFEADWTREHQRWLALREEIAQRQTLVVTPLADREQRLRDAAAQGLVPLARWVDASRDHREARHETLLLRAELQRSSARALALNTLLETP